MTRHELGLILAEKKKLLARALEGKEPPGTLAGAKADIDTLEQMIEDARIRHEKEAADVALKMYAWRC